MRKRLKEQTDSMTAFFNFCKQPEHVPIWEGLSGFANGVSALDLKIQKIIFTESEQEKNNKGVTETKKSRKTDMAIKASAIAAGLEAYSIDKGDQNLLKSMNITFSDIMRGMNASALTKAKLVYDTGKELPPGEIVSYGITDDILFSLNKSAERYSEVASSTRLVITNKTKLTNNCACLVKEANAIMRKQLLKIGRCFKEAHPDFYEGLVMNAKVYSHSVHSKIRITAETGEPANAVAEAAVIIEGTILTGATNVKGKCTVSEVPEGERQVTVIKGNMRKTFKVKFKRGLSITRKVDLDPVFDLQEPEKVG
ncbi:MAG: hypothetical protein ABIT08_06315 [Bacteroidia bacterium]